MRDLHHLRSWLAAAATLSLGLAARRRSRIHRNRARPRITPLRIIHPDELTNAHLDELRRRAG